MATGYKTGGRTAGTPNKISREVRAAAMQHTGEALAALVELMTGAENESVRLGACKEVLDRACGKVSDGKDVLSFERSDARRGMPQPLEELLAQDM